MAKYFLYYDAECRFCVAVVWVLEKMDLGGRLELRCSLDGYAAGAGLGRADLSRSAYLVTPEGRAYEGFHAFRRLSLLLPLLRPLAPLLWFPGMGTAGEKAYRWVADNRSRLLGCTRS